MSEHIDTAIKNMWTIADKPERLRCFHKIVFELDLDDPAVLWREFWRIWTSSENLNEDEDFIREIVDLGMSLGHPTQGLDEDDAEKFKALPERLTVYRGGIEANRIGWSWTLNREKAHWFAKRAFGPEQRFVSRLEIDRSDVLAYLTGRGEDEIVIDPASLDPNDVEIDEAFEAENGESSGLFYAIQSGRLNIGGDEHDRFTAEMIVRQISDDAVEKNIAELREIVEFSKWAGLRTKLGYCEQALSMLCERQAEAG